MGVGLPRQVEDPDVLEHKTAVEMPEDCGKCGSRALRLLHEGQIGVPRRVECMLCGWNIHLVRAPHAPAISETVESERGYAGLRRIERMAGTTVRVPRERRTRLKRRRVHPEPPAGLRGIGPRFSGPQLFPRQA